jgi:7-cyano-7-deazaguanine synthase
MKKAVILYSGGLDSTTMLALAQAQNFELYTLTFDYGQRHACEITIAKTNIKHYQIKKNKIISINLRDWGGSSLTDDIQVPKHDSVEDIDTNSPSTYVPARNTIFLSYALAWAEVIGARDIFIGVNSVDYSGYPDCRPEYIDAFSKMANLATKDGVEGNALTIHTPLIKLSKGDIILKGLVLGVNYANTHSCYDPTKNGLACRHCDSCLLRQRGFEEAGIPDPVKYI